MGQKVNPHGLRVGVIKNWDSRWYASDENFGDILVSDYNLRKFLKTKLLSAGISKIEIERDAANETVKVFIHCAKPGILIGKGGAGIESIRKDVEKLTGKKAIVNVVEVKFVDTDAQLVAENICSQLERRIGFRRAMKQAIGRTMKFAKGIKIACSGRLGGAEIARTEHYHEGTIPLQTLRADIDYGFWEANTTYGKIGVKVWIYKGEILNDVAKTTEERNDRPRRRHNGNNRNDRNGKGTRRAAAPKNTTEGGAH
ncbi:MAG: 30S ribosomal protein S3 [Clostridia bacterium]|nr:30S ribosomal protein S3 [Clostridia bacterium]